MSLRHTVLCVDDEQHNLDALNRTLRKDYNVLTALSGKEGLELLRQNEVSVIVTDQRMPQMTGVEFLQQSFSLCPNTVRIILTGFTDVEDLIEAINTGQVYRYITKPWDPNDLKVTLVRAVESMELSLENKRLINNLIQMEKLATVGQVASGIAHEVKNQLSVLMGVQILQMQFPGNEKVNKIAESVIGARDRIVAILDEIKAYGKQTQAVLHCEDYPVSRLVQDSLAIVSLDPEVKCCEFEVRVEPEHQVNCDRDRIVQVLINLIRNAAHSMNGKGTIRIESRMEDNRKSVSVADSGVGIAPDQLEKIWEPFYTTKGDKGTGLGLQICKRIVEAHHGQLTCRSECGLGSTFTISLPI